MHTKTPAHVNATGQQAHENPLLLTQGAAAVQALLRQLDARRVTATGLARRAFDAACARLDDLVGILALEAQRRVMEEATTPHGAAGDTTGYNPPCRICYGAQLVGGTSLEDDAPDFCPACTAVRPDADADPVRGSHPAQFEAALFRFAEANGWPKADARVRPELGETRWHWGDDNLTAARFASPRAALEAAYTGKVSIETGQPIDMRKTINNARLS